MTTHLHHITATPEEFKDEFRTPKPIYNWAASLIGGIDYDTACNEKNALATPIWTTECGFLHGDALSRRWFGRCFNNPPYSLIEPWIAHAIESKAAITAMLIPSPNGEDRYKKLIPNAHEIVIVGRVAYIAGGSYVIKGKKGKPDRYVIEGEELTGNTRGSSLFIINGYAQGSRSFVERDWIMDNFS